MMRHDWFTTSLAFAAGFGVAVMVGARNGNDVADRTAEVLKTCDELARMDRADCFARVDVMGQALHEFADRCVLAVPLDDNLRVARMPPREGER